MSKFQKTSAAAANLISKSEELARKLGFDAVADNIHMQLEEFLKRELMIVVAGEARRGKSMLLNMLLNQTDPIFPVDINICTNVVTILRYGETERVEAIIEDSTQEKGYRTEILTRAQIPDYVSETGNSNNYKNVKSLRVSLPLPLLKDGLVFVDTPGVGSLNVEHAETTYSFLPYADLLLFVTAANAPMTQTEISFMKRAYSYCSRVVYPLTMIDKNSEYVKIQEDNRKKISAALEIAEENISVVPVSSEAKRAYLETGRDKRYKASNYETLEKTIRSVLDRERCNIIIMPYLQAVMNEMNKIASSLSAQYQVLGNREVTKRLTQDLQEQVDRIRALQNDSSDWYSELDMFFLGLKQKTGPKSQKLIVRLNALVTSAAGRMGKRLCEKEQYSKLLSDINHMISQEALSLQEEIGVDVQKQCEKIRKESIFRVDVKEELLKRIKFTGSDTMDIDFPRQKFTNRLMQKGTGFNRSTYAGSGIGSIIGMIGGGAVGFLLGGPLGALVGVDLGKDAGAMVGSAFAGVRGVADALSRHSVQDVNYVQTVMTRYYTGAVKNMEVTVNLILGLMQTEVKNSLKQELNIAVGEIRENIAQLKNGAELQKKDIPQRQAKLKKDGMMIKQQMEQLMQFGKEMNSFKAEEDKPEASPQKPRKEQMRYNFL